jgi:integrase
MARHAKLKPRKTDRATPWEISIPPNLSATGKRERRYFETQQQAEEEIYSIRNRRMSFGETLEQLTPGRAAEAVKAFKLLEGHDVTLLDVVTEWLEIHKDRNSSIPFLALFDEFLAVKHDRNLEYLRELRLTRDRWPELHPMLVSDITHRTLSPIISKLSAGARNTILRYWRAVFNLGIKRGFLAENPVNGLDFARRKRTEVETLTNAQVKQMLEHALATDLQLLPYVVLGCFAGIRPDGELQKVEWRDIDLTGKVVTIRPEVSKTNRRRFIDLGDNAKSWLEAYQFNGGQTGGLIIGEMTEDEIKKHRRINWKAAGIERWPRSGMRHTFCSNWLAKFKDVNKLTLMSGHDNPDTLWRHYFKGTTEVDAEQFWAIRPPKRKDSRKIVPFAA